MSLPALTPPQASGLRALGPQSTQASDEHVAPYPGFAKSIYPSQVLTHIFHLLQSLSRPVLFVVLVGWILVIGYFDYRSGTDATFTVLYLFPIGAAAWFLIRGTPWLFAAVSSIISVGGDIFGGAHYTSFWIPTWNLAARFAVFTFAAQLITMLTQFNRELEHRAAQRALKLTEEIATRERLQRELLQISEREQARLGHDVHDGLCQHLTGASLAAQIVYENLLSQNLPDQEGAGKVVELIQDGIGLARDLARGLSAVEVYNDGLTSALAHFAVSTSDLFNVSCRFACSRPIATVDTPTGVHLYRIAQEAVSNAIKHGDAKNIVIHVENSGSQLLLRVTDDGIGIPEHPSNGKGMGLQIMSYRSGLIGAGIAFKRRYPTGTEVICRLPLNESLA